MVDTKKMNTTTIIITLRIFVSIVERSKLEQNK